jgi:DNA polymerase-3 subunit alpha
VVSQLDKDDVEAVGLVKFDFLGLRTLTIVDWAVKYVNALEQGRNLRIEEIPLDDQETYDRIFKPANSTAVFQFESRGMKDTLVKAKPDSLEDLIALNALYRPGPMDYIPDFINRKHGRESVVIPHPSLEPVLSTTYGIMVYQEQVMQTAQVVAGYSLGGADLLRRAMGKKKAEEMAKQREIFVAGAEKNNIDAKKANEIFDTMEKFAGYGFNKSHAAAYSLVAYQTAWLKCHHPAAFMAATLSSEMDNTDKVSFFYQDTLQQGVTILPPDVNSSGYRFAPVDEKTISYGLGAIKGTGESAVDNIVAVREAGGPFKDLFDFCHRVDNRIVNRRAIEALIRGGAFDSISDHRHQLMAALDVALGSAEQRARAANQVSLFGDDEAQVMPLAMAEVPRWGAREQLQNEKQALGFYLSGHPYHEYAEELGHFVKYKLAELSPQLVGQGSNGNGGNGRRGGGISLVLAGMVSGIRIQQTRRGRMGVVTLDDGSAQVEMTVFNEIFEASRPWIREDELLVVRGKVSLDDYSGNMRITAEELFDFPSARSTFARRLELSVDAKARVRVDQLKEMFKPHCGGKCPVVIDYCNHLGCAQLPLGEEWRVSLHDDLLGGLRKKFGDQAVRLVYD